MFTAAPPIRDVVLVGGGHSHVQVLKSFGMKPAPGIRLTIISREVQTPYSGMLPGHVAGIYDRDEIHIDLGVLASFANARLIADEVVGLDPEDQRVRLACHPDLRFDYLSINCGAVPQGIGSHGVAVKPIGRFLPKLEQVIAGAEPGETIALVGGGAGGVELALALRRRLTGRIGIVVATDTLLSGHSPRVAEQLRAALAAAGVDLVTGFRVQDADAEGVVDVRGERLSAQHVLWVTSVSAPSWPRDAGLATDDGGFVLVDRQLRSTSHPNIFAAGDVASLVGQPRPKSGVFAVRQGPVLTENLRRVASGRRLRRFRAQRHFLSLIGTADGRAVASKGGWVASGRWAWWWKDRIDRRFMRRFKVLPEMALPDWALPDALRAEAPEAMRCGGCGAKLGADPLRRVLARLPAQSSSQVLLGIGDDAAVLAAEEGKTVLTVDGFRALVSDPYLFGRITAHHALNDVLAMGARGVAALAFATVPLMSEALMEEDLYQLLHGAVDVLNAQGVALVGGHSAEGAELSLALTITGSVVEPMLTKSGLQPGQRLLLTKPIGTGVLMAALMRGRSATPWVEGAHRCMDRSNAPAVAVLREHQVGAATDVSGFGLLGHLGEMLRASDRGVELDLACVPMLEGARELLAEGINSSLQQNNERVLADFEVRGIAPSDPGLRLLVDPQTSGGLLAAVPEAAADACVRALREVGFERACAIGRVLSADAGAVIRCGS